MKFSSSKSKALAVTAGFSFWFLILSLGAGLFSIEAFIIFVVITAILTQIFAVKLSKGLDIFAIINTKIFLGILFCAVISVYGILFRFLQIDLLRLKKHDNTYWLDVEQTKDHRIRKQY